MYICIYLFLFLYICIYVYIYIYIYIYTYIVLQGDEVDKIVKNVIVRASDGTYRERGLSQLSGGICTSINIYG
jgi:hypothetical protein